MSKDQFFGFLSVALSITILGMFTAQGTAAEVSKITKEELKSMLGNPDMVILDVRTGKRWKASEKKIKGAARENPKDVESWADKYPKGKTPVLY